MGERLNGIQEVSGSIPLISTKVHRQKVCFKTSFIVMIPHRYCKVWFFVLGADYLCEFAKEPLFTILNVKLKK